MLLLGVTIVVHIGHDEVLVNVVIFVAIFVVIFCNVLFTEVLQRVARKPADNFVIGVNVGTKLIGRRAFKFPQEVTDHFL